MSVFIDTNVLLYAVLQDNAEKQEQARHILQQNDCMLSVQVLSEFVVQATRPSRADRLTTEQALLHVANWRRFPVQNTTLALFDQAARIFAGGGFSFWDALIVAAARAQGCDTLYTEDMQDGRILDELRIVNPFT